MQVYINHKLYQLAGIIIILELHWAQKGYSTGNPINYKKIKHYIYTKDQA